ncbi:transposase [Amycolatopsis speibonae]|uniref:Transposase n=1 Tax=Amycolatopsis speibonae TaxID=1450224 RepID=A0ABV7P649_9PSEU
MSSKRRRFSPEYREMVIETSRPTAQVARELGIGEQSLGNWVAKYRQDHADDEPALDLEELKRQTRGTQDGERVPKKFAAYFAQNQQ